LLLLHKKTVTEEYKYSLKGKIMSFNDLLNELQTKIDDDGRNSLSLAAALVEKARNIATGESLSSMADCKFYIKRKQKGEHRRIGIKSSRYGDWLIE
jgi:hypothetical protein